MVIMKKLNFWLLASLFVAAFAFTACSSSDSDSGGGGEVPAGPGSGGDPDNMVFAAVSGVVTIDWSPAYGVTVTSGTQTTTTDLNGFYKFDQVNAHNGQAIIKFSKAGYASVVRTVAYDASSTTRLDATLVALQTKNVTAGSASSMTVNSGSYSGSATINFPGAFKKEDGSSYTGTVTVDAVFLHPDEGSFSEQMPGDLSAVRESGAQAQLISYGMVNVEMTGSSGEKLQLADNNPATVSFPVPSRIKQNPPASIPLWHFDEATGLWNEAGAATYDATNQVYKGQVKHFSWTNLDSPELRAHLKVTVKDSKGNLLPNVPVDIDGQRTFYTDSKGLMKCDVVSNTDLKISIPTSYYRDKNGNGVAPQTIKLGGDKTGELTFTIPSAQRIYGTVNNTAGSNICSVYIIYDFMTQTDAVMSDLNGAFSLFGPDYTGAATLVARFGDGSIAKKEFTLNGSDQRVDIEVTTPSGAGTGMFRVENAQYGLNVTIALPAPKEGGLWKATLENGTLTVSGQGTVAGIDENDPNAEWKRQEGAEHFEFTVSGYSESKETYDAADFTFSGPRGPHHGLNIYGANATIKVVNGTYNITMNKVSGTYSDQMAGIPDQCPVTATVEFSANK